MNRTTALRGMGRILVVGPMLCGAGHCLAGAEVTITRTNVVERWITNVIEVRMPVNRFVNEYQTNWVMRTVTNRIEVPATRTNYITAYQTNWVPRHLTNQLTVNLVRTNYVDRYLTNWSTLTLTNWATVLVLRTNWVTQAATNVIQVDLPSPAAAAVPAPGEVIEPQETAVQTTFAPATGNWSGLLAIEAVRTARASTNDLVEVRLKARWTTKTAAPLQVQHWRVEREDGAVLIFGQEQEFKRQLPAGKYKVEARLKPEGDNPSASARGTLSVTAHEASIQPRLLVRK